MFKTRLISGIVLVIILLFFLISGGRLLWGFISVISMIGLFELYRVYDIEKKPLGMIGYLTAAAYDLLVLFGMQDWTLQLLVCSVLLYMAAFVLNYPKYTAEEMIIACFGVIYVPVMLSYVYQVRALQDGMWLVWLVAISAWGCDTMAYCTGRLFGKHKLTPILSPKKTIEGALGGIIGAGLIGAVYGGVLASKFQEFPAPALACALICAVGGACSQIGDLTASGIKRAKNIKDYGHLIPGHGGIMDRFDSMIVTAPMIYFLALILKVTV